MANNDYITTDCKLTVSKNTAKLDEEIFLYKNDRNIKLLIEIVDNKYRYKSDDLSNLLVKYKASYAQVKWYKNAEVKKEFPIQATDDGKVVFVIEGQLIDEDTELGDYDLQLRLLNESQESIRSLPIIKGAVHILKPLFEEGDIATVNSAVADVSMLSLDGDAIDTYNSDGTYNQTNWGNGDVISSAKLNKLEKVAKDNVDKVNKMPAKSIVEGGKIYLAKEDGTKLDSGTELPAGGSTIEVVNNLESDSTTAALSAAQGKALNTQYKDIANYSLVKHTDGKVYIKKQDGTLLGTGIEIGGNDIDLSKITMSMSGQTLKLLNDGTQIATVEIPTAVVTDAQLTSIIQSKIDDGTITNMTIPDDSITTKKLNIAPKVVNIITNPDFSNGTTGYTLSSSTTVISDDGVEVTPTAQNGGISKRDILFTNEHKIYVSTLVKTNSSNVELQVYNPRFSRDIYYSNSGEFERLSDIFTSNPYKCNINVKNTSDDSSPFIVKSFTCIDLTEAFGSGNEPDKEYMDEFLNGFNNGVIVNDGLQILGDTHIRNKRIDNILPKITKIEDTDENIVYYGAWTKETNSNYDNNSSHYSSDKSSYMEYTFRGTGINIYDVTGHNKGMVEIFIDGVSKGTIDRYTSGMVYKTLLYSIKNLNFDTHTIKVVVTRTKNDRSSEYTFTFDYLEILDYFPLNNTDKEKETSIYTAKILNTLSDIVKDSKLTVLKHTNAITINIQML